MCTKQMAAQLRDLAKRCEACQYRQPATRWDRTRERLDAKLKAELEKAEAEKDSDRYDIQTMARGKVWALRKALRMLDGGE